MFTWRIQRVDGQFLRDDGAVSWTPKALEAAEYDSIEGAKNDIAADHLTDCRPVVTNGAGDVVRTT